MKRTLRVPTNDVELAEYEAERHRLHPSVNRTNIQAIAPRTEIVDQVSPFGLNRRSSKWSTALPRGFNQDDLKTYIVRESDKLTAALFDRYILQNGPCNDEANETLGKRILERLGNELPERKSIKQRFRDTINGSTSAQVDGNEKKRLENRDYYSSPTYVMSGSKF
jgi:hypothetical protein